MKPVDLYREFLSICPANTPALKERAFNVRYQVYSKEIGFNVKPEGEPEIETDEHDSHARHCLLMHKPSGRAIGCARLIMPDPNKLEMPLPFETLWIDAIDRDLFDPDLFLPGQVVEFSRIAVIEEFRRRDCSHRNLHATTDDNYFPVIPLSLFLASLSMMIASEADYGFAMMEPKLVRLLRRFGILFEPIGEAVNHFGWRSPFIIHRDNVLRYFKRGVGDLFWEINKSLEASEPACLVEAV